MGKHKPISLYVISVQIVNIFLYVAVKCAAVKTGINSFANTRLYSDFSIILFTSLIFGLNPLILLQAIIRF